MSFPSVILDEQNGGGLPAAYWPLDEARGTVAADLMTRARGSANDGAVSGGVSWDQRPGPVAREGGWASFDGTGRINCGTLGNLGANLGNGLTVEFCMQTTETNLDVLISSQNGGYTHTGFDVRINQASSGAIHLVLVSEAGIGQAINASAAGGINDGKVHHAMLAFTPPATVNIYVDGVSLPVSGSDSPGSSFANFLNSVAIGCMNFSGSYSNFYVGKLGRVAVWNRPLGLAGAKAHYLAALNGSPDIRLLG